MSKPEVDEVLFAYIAVTSHAMSLVLIWDDSGVQKPVYYVSKSLHKAEVCYLPFGKDHSGRGAYHVQASPLLLVTHGRYPNPTPSQISTSEC